ncbi:substrate-binding domain-containing protein [Pelosinus sp. sgz500959]|uniref:substrate-binding domain-containing protein n=1 Tax=Pelosinus sp. sgz500959 TaxID=3242472 RepID=UPI00366A5734
MSDTVSYTPEEVARILKISRFTVYEFIKRGELTAYHIGRKLRIEATDLEIFMKNAKGANQIPPQPTQHIEQLMSPSLPSQDGLIIYGQDATLDVLTRHLEKKMPHVRFLRSYNGSMDGLIALYRGTANLITTHLWDGDTGEYNTPYVRHLLPGQRALIINLVYRQEGFYVAPGNPKNIKDWPDLLRSDIRFINRERGSGARVLLDEKFRKLNLDPRGIPNYNQEETSHLAIASSVARGEADVGLGIEKAAMQVQNIEFIPLQKERYDLVMLRHDLEKPHFQALLSILRSPAFRNEIAGMGGYDVSRMGDIMAEL